MAFKVGSIYGEAILDTKNWKKGVGVMQSGLKSALNAVKNFALMSGAAFTGYVVLATKKANDFQKALSNVNTLLDSTQVNTAGMSRSLLMMDSSLGNTIELTEGLYQAISAGADPASEALGTLEDSAKFAKAALTDTYTAVDLLTTATNAYGSELMNSQKAADIFFTTIKQGKINGEQLASTIGQSIPLFASVKIPLEELSTGMAAMTKQGISAAESTTQLNAIVNSFLKPSGEMVNLLDEIGYSSGSAFLEAEGLTGALELLEEATDGDATKLAELLPNVRALRGAMALTGEGGKEFTNILEEMENAVGATDEAFEKQEKTWDTLLNSLGKTQIIVGNVSKYFADDLADGLIEATDALNEFLLSAEGFDLISNIIVNTAGTFAVLSSIVETLFFSVMQPAEEIFSTVSTLMNDLKNETDGAFDAFSLLGFVVNWFSSLIQIAGQYVSGIVKVMADWIRLVVEAGKTIKSFFKALKKGTWKEFTDQGKQAGNALKEVGKGYLDFYTDLAKTTSDKVKNMTTNAQEQAEEQRKAWTDTTNDMRKKVSDNYDKMFLGIQNTMTNALNAQEDMIQERGKDLGKNLGEGLTDGFEDETKNLNSVIEDWIKKLPKTFQKNRSAFKAAWDNFAAPALKAFEFVMQNISKAFNGIMDTIDMALSQETEMIKAQNAEKLDLLEEEKENRLTSLDDEFTQRQEKLLEDYENGLISLAEFNNASDALLEERANREVAINKEMETKIEEEKNKGRERENAAKKKEFEANKANQIANIWIQYAIGLAGLWMQSMSQLGPIAGAILAGIMTATLTGIAIAQTVLISRQQFVPAREKGGRASGLTRINEKGGEIVNLPDGSIVIPNDISEQIAMNSGMANQIVYNIIMREAFKGAIISDMLSLNKIAMKVSQILSRQLKLKS